MKISVASLALATLPFLTSPALAEIDACLVGSWRVDMADLGTVMGDTMNGTATIIGGDVTWDIAPNGNMRITVIDLVARTQVTGAPQIDVTVNGYSAGHISAEDGIFNATVSDYALVGRADVMGTPMEIPFTSETGMFGGGLGQYGCLANSLSLDQSGTATFPRHWTR